MNEDIQLRATALEFATRLVSNNTSVDLISTAEAIYKFLKGA